MGKDILPRGVPAVSRVLKFGTEICEDEIEGKRPVLYLPREVATFVQTTVPQDIKTVHPQGKYRFRHIINPDESIEWWRTKKKRLDPRSRVSRREFNTFITPDEYSEAWWKDPKHRIEKDRWDLTELLGIKNGHVHLDRLKGGGDKDDRVDGIWLLEREATSVKELKKFQWYEWTGDDMTETHSNKWFAWATDEELAEYPYPRFSLIRTPLELVA